MKILFSWEFGANLGHLARDYPLASRFLEMNHEVVFVVPNPIKAENFSSKFRYIETPHHTIQGHGAPLNYSAMLLMLGFGSSTACKVIDAWVQLLSDEKPDLVVINHSFTALVAARFLNIRTLVIGTAWEIPSEATVQPPWGFQSLQDLSKIDKQLMDVIKPYVQVEFLHEVFGKPYLTTIPELDFHSRPNANYIGYLGDIESQSSLSFESSKTKIFAYLRTNHHSYYEQLAALNACGAEVICYIADLLTPQEFIIAKMYSNLRVTKVPQRISDLKPDLVLSYGSTTVTDCVTQGIPVLMLPKLLEQKLVGDKLQASGAGISLSKNANVQAGIYQALDCKEAAMQIKASYNFINPVDYLIGELILSKALLW